MVPDSLAPTETVPPNAYAWVYITLIHLTVAHLKTLQPALRQGVSTMSPKESSTSLPGITALSHAATFIPHV